MKGEIKSDLGVLMGRSRLAERKIVETTRDFDLVDYFVWPGSDYFVVGVRPRAPTFKWAADVLVCPYAHCRVDPCGRPNKQAMPVIPDLIGNPGKWVC